MLDEDMKSKVSNRLRRAKGQLDGIERMIADDRYCVDVLFQIAAVRAALGKAAELLLENHVNHCVSHALSSGTPSDRREKIDELLEVFSRFGAK
ncbi:MAG: metal-sensitive transcriptional regulator [Deltaproteobacteria bacterium]|nr:metal-sensitive transcriptional regulator [Deltaproteobacteria bacterium]